MTTKEYCNKIILRVEESEANIISLTNNLKKVVK